MPKQTKINRVKENNYSPYYAFDTEGGRIGLCTCLRCGIAIIIGDMDVARIHDKWHESQILPTTKRK